MAEQARAAGAIASVNGLNVILAPAFVFAYEHYGPAPFILTSSILLGLAHLRVQGPDAARGQRRFARPGERRPGAHGRGALRAS
jgi:hypothetical protein